MSRAILIDVENKTISEVELLKTKMVVSYQVSMDTLNVQPLK